MTVTFNENAAASARTKMISVERIFINESTRRPLNLDAVARLAKSLLRDGLKTPIDVVPIRKGILRGHYSLIAGHHRFAACQTCGMTEIPARILDRGQAKGWAEVENLLRNLSALDESIAIVNYAKKMKLRKSTLLKGRQPHDKGYSRVAEALGYARRRIAEAYAHTELSETMQVRVRELKLDDNCKFLTQLANKKVLVEQEKLLSSKQTCPKVKKASVSEDDQPPPEPLGALLACYEKSLVKKMYRKQTADVQRQFIALM
jgi:ParB/RepB/Spo0J family partition protein